MVSLIECIKWFLHTVFCQPLRLAVVVQVIVTFLLKNQQQQTFVNYRSIQK